MSHLQLITLSPDYMLYKHTFPGTVYCTRCIKLIHKRSYYIISKRGTDILCRRCALADPKRIADLVQRWGPHASYS